MKSIWVNVVFLIAFLSHKSVIAEEWFIELDVSTGYNSNIYLESEGEALSSVGESTLSGAQTNFSLATDKEIFDGKNSDVKVIADFMVEKYEYDELDSRVFYAELPYSYYLNSYRFRISPSFLSVSIAGENALNYQAIKFDITKNFGRYKAGVSFKTTNKTPQNESFEFYDGTSTEVQSFLSSALYDGFFTARLGMTDNEYQASLLGDLSNTNLYLASSYQIQYGKYSARFYAKVRNIEYVQDIYSDESRSDTNWRFSLSNKYALTKDAEMYLTTSYTDNSSNLEDYSYNQWVTSIGTKVHW